MFSRCVKIYKHTLVLETMAFFANLEEYFRLLDELEGISPGLFDVETEKQTWQAIKRGLVQRVYELEPLPVPLVELAGVGAEMTQTDWTDQVLTDMVYDIRRARALVMQDLFTQMARPEFDRVQEYIQTGLLLVDMLSTMPASSNAQQTIQRVQEQLSNELATNLRSFMSDEPLLRIVETERELAFLATKLDDSSKLRTYRNAWLKIRQKVVGTQNGVSQTTFKQDFARVLRLIAKLREDPALENESNTLMTFQLVEDALEMALNEGEIVFGFRTLVPPAEPSFEFQRLKAEFAALLDRIERLSMTPTGALIATYIRKLKALRRRTVFVYDGQEDATADLMDEQQAALQDELQAAVDALWIPGRVLPNAADLDEALRKIISVAVILEDDINELLALRAKVVQQIRRRKAGLIDDADEDMTPVGSWRRTEQQLSAFIKAHPLVERAHKAVKRLAVAEEQGQVLESVHTRPAEEKLYEAVKAMKGLPHLVEERQQIKQIIGASPRRSQLVKVRYLIRKRDSDLPGSKLKPLFDTPVKDVIICPSTTYQEIRDQEPSEKLQESIRKYGARFEGAYASFTEKRLVRKNKQFVARIKSLSQRVTDSVFTFTDSQNRKEERPFPLGRDYRNKVTLFFAWESI